MAELRQRSVKGAWHREQRGQKHGGRSEPWLPAPASHACSKLHSSCGPQLLGHSLRNAFPDALELARACQQHHIPFILGFHHRYCLILYLKDDLINLSLPQ